MENTAQTQQGMFARLKARLFGTQDEVASQLREIAKQGTGTARLAHGAAMLLIVLFSLGSLVALSGQALTQVVAEYQHGAVDIPQAISIAVSTLLVLCFDISMVAAAQKVRQLRTRRQSQDALFHIGVIALVGVIEAGSYLYFSVQFDRPASLAVWLLLVARALSAPFMATYLSLVSPSPVSARDVLYQSELAVGHGLIKDAVRIARNEEASLAQKLLLYKAASKMSDEDATRLDNMALALAGPGMPPIRIEAPRFVEADADAEWLALLHAQPGDPVHVSYTHPAPITKPLPENTTSQVARDSSLNENTAEPPPAKTTRKREPVMKLADPNYKPRKKATNRPVITPSQPRRNTASREVEARAAWADGARTVTAMVTATGMSRNAASKWVRTLREGVVITPTHSEAQPQN